jgi:osomolarity two-component system, sensor histidine kinase SLN1
MLTKPSDVLGWLTIVLDARILYETASSFVGLGKTGEVLVVAPVPSDNLFSENVAHQSATRDANVPVNFILPPSTIQNRHSLRVNDPTLPFAMGDYPCVLDAWTADNHDQNNAGSHISTHNEQNHLVSCGYARIPIDTFINWVVVVEKSHGEVVGPINRFRNIILACIFSVLGAIIIVCLPLAHCAVKPIIALRSATEHSILTYEAEVLKDNTSSSSDPESLKDIQRSANGFVFVERKSKKNKRVLSRRQFQIPQKVPDQKHLLQDELTDLTTTFNAMSDELNVQYGRLEDRVKSRTAELEKSRDLARAADESKTLFIANVSHELRTPLNGIIGMCSVAMQEEEVPRIRQSLNIIYKSSDLLLHLLNDLLTFSRNSYGQKLSIEEGIFRLSDIGTQIVSIFEKQARDASIDLKVVFIGTNQPKPNQPTEDIPEDAICANKHVGIMLKRVRTNVLARGPADTGALRDMSLRGDKNRILQVMMNLVSNSLKFTPEGGTIEVRIRCKGFSEKPPSSEKVSMPEKQTDRLEQEKLPVSRSVPATPDVATGRNLDFEFEVEDTGPGIPEHLRQEIFKPFVQGDLALSRKHGGTGLGLAICAQLASLMGGGISLKSTIDIGSTFTMSLPLPYTKEKVPSLAGSLAAGTNSRRASARPSSLGSSVRREMLSTKSPRPTTRNGTRTQLSSARASVASGNDEKLPLSPQQLDQPRIVGFSQPYWTDGITVESDGNSIDAAKREREREREQTGSDAKRPRLASIASVEQKDEIKPTPFAAPAIDAKDHETDALAAVLTQTTALSGVPTSTLTETSTMLSQLSPPTTPGAVRSASPKPPGSSKPREPPLKLKVLVAEDNKVNQEVIMRMLKLERISDVTIAEDGQKALDAVKTSLCIESTSSEEASKLPRQESAPPLEPQGTNEAPSPSASSMKSTFQLIFMDIQMPNMDGIESTKHIRALGFDAPIIALTAFDHETNREACRAAGMNDFVGKPIKRSALRKVLEGFKPPDG